MSREITLNCDNVAVEAGWHGGAILAILRDVAEKDLVAAVKEMGLGKKILSEMGVTSAIEYFGKEEVLQEFSGEELVEALDLDSVLEEDIGIDKAVEHFGEELLDKFSAKEVVEHFAIEALLECMDSKEVLVALQDKEEKEK